MIRLSFRTVAWVFVCTASVYLLLANLDYVGYWHDEGHTVFIGKNLLEQGDILGWDGRNLVGGTDARTLNADLRDTFPPLMYLLNAIGFWLFGYNEIGARGIHAFLGVLSLGFFFLLLRDFLRDSPDWLFFCFLFSAFSVQLFLYFRQSRYYAASVFLLILSFYLYRRFWHSKKLRYWVAMSVVGILGFFSHYTIGVAAMLAVASWHVLFHHRDTTERDWLLFTISIVLVAIVGFSYFYWIGFFERGEGYDSFNGLVYEAYAGEGGSLYLLWRKFYIYIRDMFRVDWISWPIFLWFCYKLYCYYYRRRDEAGTREFRQSIPLIVFGLLFVFYSTLLSVQPVWKHHYADFRYYIGALPFLLVMKGLFVQWLWVRARALSVAALLVLLLSNVATYPFTLPWQFSDVVPSRPTILGMHLFQYINEISQPYPNPGTFVAEYLRENADPDDIVYVADFYDREMLIAMVGDHVLFCCMLENDNADTRRVMSRLQEPRLAMGKREADWVVLFFPHPGDKELLDDFEFAVSFTLWGNPTQRPNLLAHAFTPIIGENHEIILLRRKQSVQ